MPIINIIKSATLDGVIPVEMDITELNFKLRAKDMIRLPEHPGSTIRGALGHGLYNVCCSLRNNSCEKCNLEVIVLIPFCSIPFSPVRSGRIVLLVSTINPDPL